jgi:hypothetical protein
LDVGINKLIKNNYRTIWEKYNCELDEKEKAKLIVNKKKSTGNDNITHETFITWVSKSLRDVPGEIIQNAFNCLISKEILDQAMIKNEKLDDEESNDDLVDILKELREFSDDELSDEEAEETEERFDFIEDMLCYEIQDL